MAFSTGFAEPSDLPQDPDEFEDYVKQLLEKNYGYKVIKPPKNQHGYDLEIKRNGKSIAVQVKNYKRAVNTAQVQKFTNFMELEITNRQFSEGWLISSRGFSRSSITNLSSESRQNKENWVNQLTSFGASNTAHSKVNVSLGTVYQNGIKWDYLNSESLLTRHSPSTDYQSNTYEGESRRYFGIFTNKGGTGKTTVAAHLAGAFALMGYDVILLDIDPQKNLTKLFQNDFDNNEDDGDSSLYVKSPWPGGTGNVITVLDHDQWEDLQNDYNDAKIVICDCSPTFENNPISLVEKFDYCVIPTTLNPLGIAKNSNVIRRTFDKIRTKNAKAELFALINYYIEDTKSATVKKRNQLLLSKLKEQINFDQKFYLIDPINDCAIHRSDSLYYWGLHVVTGDKPELAFKSYGGKSVPRTDFFKLAEYLESHDKVSLTKT